MFKKTNLDVIRKIPKEKIAEIIFENTEFCKKIRFCRPENNLECAIMLELDKHIPKEMCIACIIRWLESKADDELWRLLGTQKTEESDREEETDDTF